MRKKFILIIAFSLCCQYMTSQPTTFSVFLEEDIFQDYCAGHVIPFNIDSTYIVFNSYNSVQDGIELIKINKWGEVIWRKLYVDEIGNGFAYCYGHAFKTDSGFNHIYFNYSEENMGGDASLLSFNEDGEKINYQTYGLYDTLDIFKYGSQTSDKGFIMGGFSRRYSTLKMFIVKTDELGKEEWRKFFKHPDTKVQKVNSIYEDHDGGYIVGAWASESENFAFPKEYSLVLKLNSEGEEEWRKELEGNHIRGCPVGIRPLKNEQGYIVWSCDIGKTTLKDTLYYYIAKWDENYEEVWRTELDPLFEIYEVRELTDGRFIACGHRKAKGVAEEWGFSGWLALFNADGSMIWSKDYRYHHDKFEPDYAGENFLHDVYPALDGGFIASGEHTEYMKEHLNTLWHPWVIKVDENGCIAGYPCEGDSIYLGDGPTIPVEEVWLKQGFAFRVYPNPVKGESLQISYRLPPSVKAARIELYTVTGHLVKTQSLAVAGEPKVSVSSKGLASGVYICNLVADGLVVGMEKVLVF